ncbi:MAG TPA: histidine phosphatase family protein [Steroidobacteraceae bacterium]|nr:histidine phosphatase family protein [Steroidobacteraceae bacterium]
MRELLLLRHAEAQPARPDLPDFDRRLTARGRAQARQAARRLAAAAARPGVLLASPAARTRETAEIVAAGIGYAGGIRQPPALYLASAPVLLSALRGCEDEVPTLLLVGHNPGLCALARELAQALLGGTLELGLGALCRLTVDVPAWRELTAQAVSAVSLL